MVNICFQLKFHQSVSTLAQVPYGLKKIRDHVGYNEFNESIGSEKFKPCKHLILNDDADFELSDHVITAQEYLDMKSKIIDRIKENTIRWEQHKKYNHLT
jgi:hypothetical protein